MRDGHSCRYLARVKGNENRAVSLETSRRRDLLSFIGCTRRRGQATHEADSRGRSGVEPTALHGSVHREPAVSGAGA